ncbi:MAG TPA: glutaredoxin family protein [Pyrinomonadaceae bacterium]|nr:glutaredoxin family protein [Pyrinomonadaceae bacterium]
MSNVAPKAKVIIYSRPGCHLCEEAKQTILTAGNANDYTLAEINIEDDAELLRLYQFDIPVVTINGQEAFRHRLSPAEFRQALARYL